MSRVNRTHSALQNKSDGNMGYTNAGEGVHVTEQSDVGEVWLLKGQRQAAALDQRHACVRRFSTAVIFDAMTPGR
ncbi:hypothetical protein EVAR_63094_1 [Eumeta japonica]|uniref:Uncharacterized protein n=1 Tax=Eumeta variegata TaxID=151549 RepID=A0A4C2A0W5_EUMVA|nr:hypothetical protein EVAR_63094_1 [Eumeta japonica]